MITEFSGSEVYETDYDWLYKQTVRRNELTLTRNGFPPPLMPMSKDVWFTLWKECETEWLFHNGHSE